MSTLARNSFCSRINMPDHPKNNSTSWFKNTRIMLDLFYGLYPCQAPLLGLCSHSPTLIWQGSIRELHLHAGAAALPMTKLCLQKQVTSRNGGGRMTSLHLSLESGTVGPNLGDNVSSIFIYLFFSNVIIFLSG